MKLEVFGEPYDFWRVMDRADLDTLADLHEATGVGVRSIRIALVAFFKAASEGKASEAAEVPVTARALKALAYLCLRSSGDERPYSDVPISWADLGWIPEDRDTTPPDPSVASGNPSPPDAENKSDVTSKSPSPSKAKSKTSKRPSTVTS